MADSYQALYRRYRSKRFGEQVGQDHVMRALRTAVQEHRVGHAYLFSGPRGTGKTSTARILAKVLNCDAPVDGEPCCVCANCIAVDEGRIVDWLLELDAASNNGVEKIRDLTERLALGISGNRKVVILDEVHMLTGAASNALLKSLEEPPSHVVFILATTDPQKVLPTIRSRTQHFEFHLLPAEALADHVRHVISDAGLALGEDAVEQVVRQGAGSARDALSALDQVAAMGGVVEETLPVDAMLDALCTRDAGAALVAVADAVASGRDPRTLGEVLIERLRHAFLAVMGAPDRHLPPADLAQAAALGEELKASGLTRALEVLGEALVELAKKPDPRIVLEVALVRLCRPDADHSVDALLERIERLERTVAAGMAAAPTGGAGSMPAAPPAPASTASGPAAGAREELARATGSRPSPARAPVKKATSQAAAPPRSSAPASADVDPAAAAPASSPTPTPTPTPTSTPTGGGSAPALAELQSAWSATIHPALTQKPRVRFRGGEFTAVDGSAAQFALENEWARKECEPYRAEVEAAVAAHFGHPVSITLVTLGGTGVRPPATSPGEPAASEESEDAEVGDVHELDDAPTAASSVERIAEVFPGAELVDGS